MMKLLSNVQVNLFSYETIITKSIENGWKPKEIPNILLSNIKSISSDIVAEFESINIHDLQDLERFENDFKDHKPGIIFDLEKIRKYAIETSIKKNNLPQIMINLPINYGIVGLFTNVNSIDLAYCWKSLLFYWKNIANEKIPNFIEDFTNLLKYCDSPELITDVRVWNFTKIDNIEPSDISVYLSNYDIFKKIEDYCSSLNEPEYPEHISNDPVLLQIYNIEFLIWYAKKITSENMKKS